MTHLRSLSLKLAAVIACSAPFHAFAQLSDPPDVGSGDIGGGDLKQAIVKVIQVVLDFMTLIAVVMIIIAGIRYIISRGEESENEKAKKMIIYVIVGLIVILLARAIVTFVIGLQN
ncbi:MAG: TrbC/VirB2 family protein [Candidatus Peribacteraceae bacterium]|nr:TrbC/VirB2 family protein [Candidatus Peribacteraceae bacterium]MDD5739282.1 TrbC/VirB2 family protein [Candidatus Peribacteraceae bacterium]